MSSPKVRYSMPALTPLLSSRTDGRGRRIAQGTKKLQRCEALDGRRHETAAGSDLKENYRVVRSMNATTGATRETTKSVSKDRYV